MKVERKAVEPAFVPIVITLETEAEAENLWHRLNNNGDLRKYCEEGGFPPLGSWGKWDDINGGMWEALNRVFQPTRDC